jgi:hypothetical protein
VDRAEHERRLTTAGQVSGPLRHLSCGGTPGVASPVPGRRGVAAAAPPVRTSWVRVTAARAGRYPLDEQPPSPPSGGVPHVARRLFPVTALAAIALLSLPTAAFAEYVASVQAPKNGVVSGSKDIQVRIDRELTDPSVVELRVRPASGGELRPTTCISGCERGDRTSVFAFTLDPRSGAPFGDTPLPNGRFEFEGVLSRDIGGERSTGRLALSLRVPGSAVGGLAATVSDQTVRLAWRAAPEPDISGYRVERCEGVCDGNGRWQAEGAVAASATSFNHAPSPGEHSYRVVTVRDGGDDGDGTIETVSSPVVATVQAPSATTSSNGGSGTGSRGTGDAPGAAPSDTGAPRSGDLPDLAAGDAPERRASDHDARSARGGTRAAPPPSVALDRSALGIPELPGLGDIFRGELDYSGADRDAAGGPDDARPAGEEGDEVLLSAPGSGSFMGQLTDPDRVAVPIAGGLLMTAIGLHLWRWLRFPLTVGGRRV